MNRHLIVKLVSTALLVGSSAARAEDAKKADPTGTWQWKTNVMGQEIETTLKLKWDGTKLTGVIVGDDKEVKIDDGKFKDGEIAFKAVRVRSGQEIQVSYKGKLNGDAIKGKIMADLGGQEFAVDWDAKRVKADKKADK
jgi:hypothetical protein